MNQGTYSRRARRSRSLAVLCADDRDQKAVAPHTRARGLTSFSNQAPQVWARQHQETSTRESTAYHTMPKMALTNVIPF
jgi:hypothetical protein